MNECFVMNFLKQSMSALSKIVMQFHELLMQINFSKIRFSFAPPFFDFPNLDSHSQLSGHIAYNSNAIEGIHRLIIAYGDALGIFGHVGFLL